MNLSLRESVKKRPGMYFGHIEFDGTNSLVYELLDNAIDLFLEGDVKEINVLVEGNHISVSDDGSGYKYNEYNKKYGLSSVDNEFIAHEHTHIKGFSLGLAVLNIASKTLKIESCDGEFKWSQVFSRGNIISLAKPEKTDIPKGTTVSLTLDDEIFQGYTPNLFELRKKIFDLVHLYPRIKIKFNNEMFYSRNGLVDYGYLLANPTCHDSEKMKIFKFQGTKNSINIQAVAIGDSEANTQCYSWVNQSRTVNHGTHLIGFQKALSKNNWNPIIALIHLEMDEPQYSGCYRDKIVSKEVSNLVENELFQEINNFLKT